MEAVQGSEEGADVLAETSLLEVDLDLPSDAILAMPRQESRRLSFIVTSLALFDQEEDRASDLIESFLPLAVPSPAATEQLRRNAEARSEFLQEYGLMTSADVADSVGSAAKNRAARAHKLAKEGKIFPVRHRGSTYYPAFQFGPDGPLPAIADVLEPLHRAGLRGWELALWFTTPNDMLDADGEVKPVDLLEQDPQAVLEAAEHEADVPY